MYFWWGCWKQYACCGIEHYHFGPIGGHKIPIAEHGVVVDSSLPCLEGGEIGVDMTVGCDPGQVGN